MEPGRTVDDDNFPEPHLGNAPLLDVQDLTVIYRGHSGPTTAVKGISFQVNRGEIVGVVGESGSGKSTLAMALLRLLPNSAEVQAKCVTFEDQSLLPLSEKAMRAIRGAALGFVPQNPLTALNPVLTVGYQVREALTAHQSVSRDDARKRAEEALTSVGIGDARDKMNNYPHEFSGGMRQRTLIAMAMLNHPSLLIADEPTTALDVTVQAQILRLIGGHVTQSHTSLLLITHNMGVVAEICDRVIVMFAGEIVEDTSAELLFTNPRHPYTKALLRSAGEVDSKTGRFEVERWAPDGERTPS